MRRQVLIVSLVFLVSLLSATANAAVGGSVSGRVFQDTNGNGVLDGGEPGIAGVSVTSDLNADGSVENTQITDVNGNYTFFSLSAGTYRIRQILPAGAFQTSANPADLTLAPSGTVSGVNFGNFFSSISGQVFNDTNGNGAVNAGETGLAGVTVNLDAGANGTVDATAVTNATGNYAFNGLAPGTYRVRQVLPAGAAQTSANPADIVAAVSGTNATGIDFGDFFFAISGQAFNDTNNSGTINAGEPGVPGVTIQLDLGADGTVDATVITDATGSYSFPTLGPGTYRIRQVVPAGRTQTSPNPADIVATSGAPVSGVNFGSILSVLVPALGIWMLALLAVMLGVIALKR